MNQQVRIILTRSFYDNLFVEKQIKDSEHCSNPNILCLNLISFQNIKFDFDGGDDDYSNIIITSKHTASILPKNTQGQNAYVVGNYSANILENKGYNIKCVAKNASELRSVIESEIDNNEGESFIYFSGDHITLEMPSYVRREIIYKTEYKESLSAEEIAFIKEGVDIIPVYSVNCAKTLINILDSNNLIKKVANSSIIAISSNVADVLVEDFKNVIVVDSPTQITEKILEICQTLKIKK